MASFVISPYALLLVHACRHVCARGKRRMVPAASLPSFHGRRTMLNFCLIVWGVCESCQFLLRPNLAREGARHTLTTPFVNPFQLIVLHYRRGMRTGWAQGYLSSGRAGASRRRESSAERSGRFSWWVLSLSLLTMTWVQPLSHTATSQDARTQPGQCCTRGPLCARCAMYTAPGIASSTFVQHNGTFCVFCAQLLFSSLRPGHPAGVRVHLMRAMMVARSSVVMSA